MFRNLLLVSTLVLSINASQYDLKKINEEIKVQCTNLGIETLKQSNDENKQHEIILNDAKNYLQNFSYLNDKEFVNQYIYGQCIEVAIDYIKENK